MCRLKLFFNVQFKHNYLTIMGDHMIVFDYLNNDYLIIKIILLLFFFQIIFNTFFVIFYLNITVRSFSWLCEPQEEKVVSCQEAHCFWVVIL
uniref:Uncharacterized protein n=1 Tax=Anguilla anguilla TaxID=7936 RepID=A0A0E9XTD7_ANGAN